MHRINSEIAEAHILRKLTDVKPETVIQAGADFCEDIGVVHNLGSRSQWE
jgi:hypothetical protein